MVSRDGRDWARPVRQPFIPLDPRESWRHGVINIFANPPIERDRELWIYYGGSTGTVEYYGNDEPFQALSLARMRKDGFVSVDAGPEGGELLTRPLVLRGRKLRLNADASGGEIRVEIRDLDGRAMAGYTSAECAPLGDDARGATLRWNGSDSLHALGGSPVRLLISMKQARLYSLWTE